MKKLLLLLPFLLMTEAYSASKSSPSTASTEPETWVLMGYNNVNVDLANNTFTLGTTPFRYMSNNPTNILNPTNIRIDQVTSTGDFVKTIKIVEKDTSRFGTIMWTCVPTEQALKEGLENLLIRK